MKTAPKPPEPFSPQPPPSRRGFLRSLALGSAGVAAEPLLRGRWLRGETHAGGALPPVWGPADEAYWAEVKAAFIIRPGLVPLNAANLCPAPRAVVEAVERAGRDVDADVSSHNRARYDELRETVRGRIAAFLNVEADEIAVVRNTSEGNNTIVSGLALGPGDEVVIFDQNHATNNVSWDVRAAERGFQVRKVAVDSPRATEQDMLATFVGAFGARTRAVSFSDVSNVSGVRLPVRAVCEAARSRGIHAHVDGAQSFGAERVDLRAYGCDSYATSAHKWFMGPKEAGVLYVRAERIGDVRPLGVGVGWGSGPETTARGARKFETLGQRNDAAFAGLEAALDFHEGIGRERVEARVRELATLVKEGLSELGAELVTPLTPERSGGVVVARFEGADLRSLHERLYTEHAVAGAPTGGLRFCPHVYNTRADVERALEAVGRVLAGS